MVTRDFENQFKDLQDAPDLILVAQHLQILAPTPKPRLEDGRRRFLAEAARLTRQLDASRAPTTTQSRRAIEDGDSSAGNQPAKAGFAFVLPRFQSPGLQLKAAIILVVSILLVSGAIIMLPGWSSNSVSPKLATPVMSPTYTVTPTRIAMATSPQPLFPLNNAGSSTSQVTRPRDPSGERGTELPAPAPAPEPVHLVTPGIQLCILDTPYFNV